MNNLFIIGNGFDMAHFNTNYNSFKEWLCNSYGASNCEITELPKYQTNYKRLEGYDINKMATFFTI